MEDDGSRRVIASQTMVVDASVAAKWALVDEEDSQAARRVLTRFRAGSLSLIAPEQIRYEVPNAIAVATVGRSPRLSASDGQAATEEFLALGLQTVTDDQLISDAYARVHRYGCGFYDALYVALAEQLGVPLITADRRLFDRLRFLTPVIWIGDYA